LASDKNKSFRRGAGFRPALLNEPRIASNRKQLIPQTLKTPVTTIFKNLFHNPTN
jgi:hypothetical protein